MIDYFRKLGRLSSVMPLATVGHVSSFKSERSPRSNRGKLVMDCFLALLLVSQLGWGQNNASPMQPADPARPQVLTLSLQLEGFAHETLTVKAGYYIVVIFNHSGARDLEIDLERMPGASVDGAAAQQFFGEPAQSHNGIISKMVNLSPGTYRVRVPKRPSWVYKVVVQ
jgi:hypothetical protein